jgi:hypothetical protein
MCRKSSLFKCDNFNKKSFALRIFGRESSYGLSLAKLLISSKTAVSGWQVVISSNRSNGKSNSSEVNLQAFRLLGFYLYSNTSEMI